MKKIILLISMLAMVFIAGCTGGNTLSFVGDNPDFLPINKTCITANECVKYVEDQGGDGSPAKCIQGQCAYQINIPEPMGGD